MRFKDVDLKELIQMMKDHDVAEIELKDGKIKIEIKRNIEPMVLNREDALVRYYERSSEPNSLKREAEITAGRNENQEGEDPLQNNKNNGKYHIVEAPLVGTFYRASSPDEEPFVEVGDQVADGDILCIVEAMKSMNEIQADVSGVIKEICVNNSELVEFEQPLFKIDTGS
jgi:acetyl-CoA carboxylase biotin carboxyl carrier protein